MHDYGNYSNLFAYSGPIDGSDANAAASGYQSAPGIWGVLVAKNVTLEPPDRLTDEIIERFPWTDGPV